MTTNFDRLLEQALKERGVTPTVIAKPSDAEGAAPLAHEEAVILKINGDYKASTLKNTADEPVRELDRPSHQSWQSR